MQAKEEREKNKKKHAYLTHRGCEGKTEFGGSARHNYTAGSGWALFLSVWDRQILGIPSFIPRGLGHPLAH